MNDREKTVGEREPMTPEQERREPGSESEPRRGEGKPVQEYPGEGVRSHYPTDPATGEKPRTPAQDESGDENSPA